jgi:hypothetical protein
MYYFNHSKRKHSSWESYKYPPVDCFNNIDLRYKPLHICFAPPPPLLLFFLICSRFSTCVNEVDNFRTILPILALQELIQYVVPKSYTQL